MHETLIDKIVEAKRKGVSDQEIGDKYGLSLREIEKAITKKYGINISNLNIKKEIKSLSPKNFQHETSTVWSFKSRGTWATHNGNYRGNWSPYIPRNVICHYSEEDDLVLDYFCGAGTTAVECKLLRRNFIGYDINPSAVELALNNINFNLGELFESEPNVNISVGDARDLSQIEDESIDLICAHPPYADIIHYTDGNPKDLSQFSMNSFLLEMDKVANESYRVLKNDKYCAILIGDMRKNKNVIPLGFYTIERFLKAGFQIKDLIIKRQHNCKTTGFWYTNSIKYNFLLLAHEYLVIFKKTKQKNDLTEFAMESNNIPEASINQNITVEGTTVWIFKENNWFENLISNLVLRYSKESHVIYANQQTELENKRELVITFDRLFKKEPEKIIRSANNFIAVICEDIKFKNQITKSTALEILQLTRERMDFKIKEIIIVSLENNSIEKQDNNMNISHKYILIFKREKI